MQTRRCHADADVNAKADTNRIRTKNSMSLSPSVGEFQGNASIVVYYHWRQPGGHLLGKVSWPSACVLLDAVTWVFVFLSLQHLGQDVEMWFCQFLIIAFSLYFHIMLPFLVKITWQLANKTRFLNTRTTTAATFKNGLARGAGMLRVSSPENLSLGFVTS